MEKRSDPDSRRFFFLAILPVFRAGFRKMSYSRFVSSLRFQNQLSLFFFSITMEENKYYVRSFRVFFFFINLLNLHYVKIIEKLFDIFCFRHVSSLLFSEILVAIRIIYETQKSHLRILQLQFIPDDYNSRFATPITFMSCRCDIDGNI